MQRPSRTRGTSKLLRIQYTSRPWFAVYNHKSSVAPYATFKYTTDLDVSIGGWCDDRKERHPRLQYVNRTSLLKAHQMTIVETAAMPHAWAVSRRENLVLDHSLMRRKEKQMIDYCNSFVYTVVLTIWIRRSPRHVDLSLQYIAGLSPRGVYGHER